MMDSNAAGRPALLFKPYFWLIFSLYYFMPLFFVDYGAPKLTLYLLAYGAFVVCYVSACRHLSRGPVHWPVAGIIGIAVGASPITASVDTFFAYGGLLIGLMYPPKIVVPAVAALVGVCIGLGVIHEYPFPFLSLTGSFAVVALACIGVAERLRRQMYQRGQRSREEIQQLATIAERERIARDLHDILGHSLSSIALKTELAKKLLDQNQTETAGQQLTELNQIARESLQLVRQTVSGYKHQGLSQEVVKLCARLRQSNFAVRLEGDVPQLNSKAETTLILALTELVTNVLRHSRGNRCQLSFAHNSEHLTVSVSDDGQNADIRVGNGLRGIRERLGDLNGHLRIDTGQQSRFIMKLPWARMSTA